MTTRMSSRKTALPHRRAVASALVLASSLSLGACQTDDEAQLDELDVTCDGKCDGFSSIKSLVKNPSDLSLDDLLGAGVPLVIGKLNDLLSSSSFVDIKLADPVLHDAAAVDALTSGLATMYGERELTTEVNAARREHLAKGGDTLYAELALKIDASFAKQWQIPVKGLDLANRGLALPVGFDTGASLEGRLIQAHPIAPSDPLAAAKALRGFVVPRSVAELGEMKPGEVVALRGKGRLGVNLSVGTPLVIAEPLSVLSYKLVLTAGLVAYLEGVLDVQLVRMGGSEVVLDVGVQQAKVRSARVAIEDGWGVQGLPQLNVDIGAIKVDLGQLVGNALARQLNDKVNLIAAHASSTTASTRASVARFRFDLASADPAQLEAAIAQALVGDVRLAQALANRAAPGVRQDFDLLRSGVASTSDAGIDLLGLSFYRKTITSVGEVVAQTPGGVRSLLFDSLHEEGGIFVSSHGYTRVGLAGLSFSPDLGPAVGETNLIVQLREADKGMERDKLVDHLDALIVALAGRDAFAAIDGPANDLERFAQSLCPGAKVHDACVTQAAVDPMLAELRAAAMAAFAPRIASLPDPTRELLETIATHKLLAQGTFEIQENGFIGPGTSVFVDFRLDDGALAQMAIGRTGAQLSAALVDILGATETDRDTDPAELGADRREVAKEAASDLATLAAHYDAFAADYQRLLAAETANIAGIGLLGPTALEIRFPIDTANRPKYAEATARSLAQARSQRVMQMFDAMHADADGLGPHAEQVVAYGLVALAPADNIDLRVAVDHFLEDTTFGWREPYRVAMYPEHVHGYARGPRTAPIDGGAFDINALVDLK
jgi:hypothetical protein